MFSLKHFLYRRVADMMSKSDCGSTDSINYGISCVTGWRRSQEDRFKFVRKIYKDFSYFAVFDGHGGLEVAVYLKRKLHEFIMGFLDENDDVELALKLSFLSCDMSILEPETQELLNAIIAEKTEVSGPEARLQIFKQLAGLLQGYGNNENSRCIEESGESNNSGALDEEGPKTEEPFCESIEGVAGSSQDVKDGRHDVEEITIQKKSVDQAEESNKSTADEDAPKSKQPRFEFGEGVAGPSQDMKGRRHDLEAVPSDRPELSSDNMSESPDDPETSGDQNEEEDDDDDENKNESQVLRYLVDDELEESDPADESYDSEDDETDSESDDETGNEASSGRTFEMEPGIQSGSTATVVLINKRKIYIANVGDSRCVLSRNGKAIHISVDHGPENEEEKIRILESGATVEDGRINGGLNLSRAFGDFMYKRNSELDVPHQAVSVVPHVAEIEIDSSMEFIVLASDGIWNSMSSQEVVDFIRCRLDDDNASLDHVCEELFRFILPDAITADGTGCDNMTCIIIKLNHKPDDNIFKDESETDVQIMPPSLDECNPDAPNVPARNIGTARKKITRYPNAPRLSHLDTENPYGPSTSRGTVIQRAQNQADLTNEDDDDDDDCEILWEHVNRVEYLPAPEQGLPPQISNRVCSQHGSPLCSQHANSILLCPHHAIPFCSPPEVHTCTQHNISLCSQHAVPFVEQQELFKCVPNVQSDANAIGKKELLRKSCEPEDSAKQIGKGSEDLSKDEAFPCEATKSCLGNEAENPAAREGNTPHSEINVENELIDSSGLGKGSKRSCEDYNAENLKKSKYRKSMEPDDSAEEIDKGSVGILKNEHKETKSCLENAAENPATMEEDDKEPVISCAEISVKNEAPNTSGLDKELKHSSADQKEENLKKPEYIKSSKSEDSAKQTGKVSEDIKEIAKSCLENPAAMDHDDEMPVTCHSEISDEIEVNTSELAQQLKRSSEDENTENFKKTKYM